MYLEHCIIADNYLIIKSNLQFTLRLFSVLNLLRHLYRLAPQLLPTDLLSQPIFYFTKKQMNFSSLFNVNYNVVDAQNINYLLNFSIPILTSKLMTILANNKWSEFLRKSFVRQLFNYIDSSLYSSRTAKTTIGLL